jgi:hypothetical protein
LAKAKAERERAAALLDEPQAQLILAQATKTAAEARLMLAQAAKVRAEAEREHAQLRQQQIVLAQQIVEQYAPNLDGPQKMDAVVRLLPVLQRLLLSDIEPVDPPQFPRSPR